MKPRYRIEWPRFVHAHQEYTGIMFIWLVPVHHREPILNEAKLVSQGTSPLGLSYGPVARQPQVTDAH